MSLNLPEPDPETKKPIDICPECGEVLIEAVGYNHVDDYLYDGVKCPNGCDLADYYGRN